MDRTEFEKLLNREIDGLLSPEEEARLNDYTARHPNAAEEQRSLHEIHRAFESMDREPVPAGLAAQIADHVLAGPAKVHRFPSPRAVSKVAAAILIVCIAGITGWQMGIGNGNEAQAGADQQTASWKAAQHQLWTSEGLSSEQADQIVNVKLSFRKTELTKAAEDQEYGLVLGLLKRFGQLDRHCRKHGITPEEAERLIAGAK